MATAAKTPNRRRGGTRRLCLDPPMSKDHLLRSTRAASLGPSRAVLHSGDGAEARDEPGTIRLRGEEAIRSVRAGAAPHR